MTLEEFTKLIEEKKPEEIAAALDRRDNTSEISAAIATLTSRIDALDNKDTGGQPGDPDPEAEEKSIMAYFSGKEE